MANSDPYLEFLNKSFLEGVRSAQYNRRELAIQDQRDYERSLIDLADDDDDDDELFRFTCPLCAYESDYEQYCPNCE